MKRCASMLLAAGTRRIRAVGVFLRNLASRRSVLGSADVIVSMTTHGRRIRSAFLALESIAAGNDRPRRMILWLSEPEASAQLPSSLRRLQRRGLEIIACPDYGPHKKYFPYVQLGQDDRPLVTADDDVFYPRDWLRGLVRVSHRYPEAVVCHRAHFVSMKEDRTGIAPYATWAPCATSDGSALVFPTGVSGVLYPASVLKRLRQLGDRFLRDAPRADDVWLHACAIGSGHRVRQVSHTGRDFMATAGSGKSGLYGENVREGGNDRQISNTYSADHLKVLYEAWDLVEREG